jgi:MYXO-CTERM domain-containing protein
MKRSLLLFALTLGGVAHAQAQPDAPPAPCDGGLCDTTNESTCSIGSSDPSAGVAVALALVAMRRRR